MDDIERPNVRLISSVWFSFRQMDLQHIGAMSGFDYAAFSGSGYTFFFCYQVYI